jgi:hypothetical protein
MSDSPVAHVAPAVASATPAPAAPPSAAPVAPALPPDHAATARQQIEALKRDANWVKSYLAGNAEARAQLRDLYAIEEAAGTKLQVGGQTAAEMRAQEADLLVSQGLDPGRCSASFARRQGVRSGIRGGCGKEAGIV